MPDLPSIDAQRIKANWRARGPYWDAEADGLAEMAARLNAPLIEGVGIVAGQQVLDLASGAGEPALTIARMVGPMGSVTATDLVEEMLVGARRRAAAADLGNIAFHVADMQSLPFEDALYDRVTCRFGVMFVPDPNLAVAEIFRVLRPGGRVGLMVWGPRQETSFFSVISTAALEVFGDDPGFEFDLPFRFGRPGPLSVLMEAAGFVEIDERSRYFKPEVTVGPPFWRAQVRMSLGPRLETASADEIESLERRIRSGFEPYRDGDIYRLKAHARLITGAKPSA